MSVLSPELDAHVEAWLDIEQTDGSFHRVEVVDGSVASKALADGVSDDVIDVSVPRWVGGTDYAPHSPTDLFGCGGQQMQLVHKVRNATGEHVWRSVWFVMETAEPDVDTIQLTGHGQISRLWNRKQSTPVQYVRSNHTRSVVLDIARRNGVTIHVDDGVPETRLPEGWIQEADPFTAVKELTVVTPAIVRETEYGVFMLPVPDVVLAQPELEFRDGDGGTVVDVPSSRDRYLRPNHIIVRSGETDTGKSFVAQAYETSGPYAVDTYGWVSEEIEIDAVATHAGAQVVATNTLWERARLTPNFEITAATDWRVALDKSVSVVFDGVTRWGHVCGWEMPATGVGTMKIEVGE